MAKLQVSASRSATDAVHQDPNAMPRKRCMTQQIDREHVDILVTRYSRLDNTLLSKLGKHCLEMVWSVQAGVAAAPMEIVVHVYKPMLGFWQPDVRITCNGSLIFPVEDASAKGKGNKLKERQMNEDFCMQWPFRGIVMGLNEPGKFEVRPQHNDNRGNGNNDANWYPATLTRRRDDGLFEAMVMMPAQSITGSVIKSITGSGDIAGSLVELTKEVHFPAVDKRDIRSASTKRPLQVAQHDLFLVVPYRNPLAANLTIDHNLRCLDYLSRQTPATQHNRQVVVQLAVSDDRRYVAANVGHSIFTYFVTGGARSVTSSREIRTQSWVIQLGPFAEHYITLEWRSWPSKLWTITIDGVLLVDSKPKAVAPGSKADTDGVWECGFGFVGEKITDSEVYETNRDGALLATKGHVVQRERYTHHCAVRLDFKHGVPQLFVDDEPFENLHPKQTEYREANLCIEREWFQRTYGFELPTKINYGAAVGIVGGLRAHYNSEDGDPNALAVAQDAAGKAGVTFMDNSLKAGSALVAGSLRAGSKAVEYASALYDNNRPQTNDNDYGDGTHSV